MDNFWILTIAGLTFWKPLTRICVLLLTTLQILSIGAFLVCSGVHFADEFFEGVKIYLIICCQYKYFILGYISIKRIFINKLWKDIFIKL